MPDELVKATRWGKLKFFAVSPAVATFLITNNQQTRAAWTGYTGAVSALELLTAQGFVCLTSSSKLFELLTEVNL